MGYLFNKLRNFNADISSWDTSSVTSMYGMFQEASSFNQPVTFDTSKVKATAGMFLLASSFNQPLFFDTSKATDMYAMFAGASALSTANKLLIRCAWAGTPAFARFGYGSSWAPGSCPGTFTDYASLKTAVQAFDATPTAAIAKYGPIAKWDVSAITSMGYLFHMLRNFNADISSWDTSSVTSMYGMFQQAYSFNQQLTFDTSKVKATAGMFLQASSFNQPLFFDTSKVTDMYVMFQGASALSATNKLFIRCAWAGTPAFARFGYGSSWAPGSCP